MMEKGGRHGKYTVYCEQGFRLQFLTWSWSRQQIVGRQDSPLDKNQLIPPFPT